jgi:hypothetical protein
METVNSIHGIPIRLTDERWVHIIENHDELAGYYDNVLDMIENPDYVIKGYGDAKIGLKKFEEGKFLAVIYRETSSDDGFREVIIWQRQQ